MTPSDLGNKLVDHDGINDPESRTQRRQQMEAILAGERAFSTKLKRTAIIAWSISMFIPIAGVLRMTAGSNPGTYIAYAFVGSVGALALIGAIMTTAAWLFRSRESTMMAIEMRLGRLEDLVERSLRRDDGG